MIVSRSDLLAAPSEVTVEAEDHETAFKKAGELLTEDDRLLSVRRP